MEGILRRVKSLVGGKSGRQPMTPKLLAQLRKQLQECAAGTGGEVAARGRAAKLGESYLGLDAAGVGSTIMCSDLGQVGVYHPVDGMRRGIRMCLDLGYSDEDVRRMFSLNTARLLGIEADVANARRAEESGVAG